MGKDFLLVGGRVCTAAGIHDGLVVAIQDGRIAAVGPASEAPEGWARLDVGGAIVAPGLIDTHLHGGLEADAMDATAEALAVISRHLVAHGVTAWVPTTVACSAAQLEAVLSAVARARQASSGGAAILGAHLESNFIAPKFKGAQPPEQLLSPGDAAVMAVIERHRDVIRIVTLAPELPGAETLIRRLVAWGIQVSIGHSDATYEQVRAGVAAGATRVTHLCNAQRGFHHREPGVLGAALVSDELRAEVIADLVHVHPAGLQIAYRCKGADGLMLVSDALRGTGLPPGEYELGGQQTRLDGTVARLEDGTIAGSTITLERAIANVVAEARIPAHTAVAMASTVPAASLGLVDRGRIAPGCRADLALFDPDWRCLGTMIAGEWVHGEWAQAEAAR